MTWPARTYTPMRAPRIYVKRSRDRRLYTTGPMSTTDGPCQSVALLLATSW